MIKFDQKTFTTIVEANVKISSSEITLLQANTSYKETGNHKYLVD